MKNILWLFIFFLKIYEKKYFYTFSEAFKKIRFKVLITLYNYKPKPVKDLVLSNREKIHYNNLCKIINKKFKNKKITFLNFGAGNTWLDFYINKKFRFIKHYIIEPKWEKKFYNNIKEIFFYKDKKEFKKSKIKVDIFYASHIINILPDLKENLDFIIKNTKKNSIIYLEFPIFTSNLKNIKEKYMTSPIISYFFKENFYKFLIKKLNAKIINKKIFCSKKTSDIKIMKIILEKN